jgi:hypothetical protein
LRDIPQQFQRLSIDTGRSVQHTRNMTRPTGRPKGRPRGDNFLAIDAMIINGAGELFRVGHCRTPSGAIREFVSRLWGSDPQAVLEIAPAFGPNYRNAIASFRPQAVGQSKEAVIRRVLRRMEPTVYRHRGTLSVGGPLFGRGLFGYAVARALDSRRGRRRVVD